MPPIILNGDNRAMKKFLLIMILATASLSWTTYEDDLRRSNQLKKTLAGYRNPEIKKIISDQKTAKEQEAIELSIINNAGYMPLMDDPLIEEEKKLKLEKKRRDLEENYSKLVTGKPYQSIFNDFEIERLKNLEMHKTLIEQLEDAKNELQIENNFLGRGHCSSETCLKIVEKISDLEEEIKKVDEELAILYREVIIREFHNSTDPGEILDFVSFLMNYELPLEMVNALLTLVSDYGREEIERMSLKQRREVMWNGLKAKIVKFIPRLTVFGPDNSYESLLEEYENSSIKGFVLDAALDANNDWDNVAVIEFIVRNYFKDQGTLEFRYDELLAKSLERKVRFLKKWMLYNPTSKSWR